MAYIANERLKVGADQYRNVGEPIPEAADWHWSIRDLYLRNRRILEVSDAVSTANKDVNPQPAASVTESATRQARVKEVTHGR